MNDDYLDPDIHLWPQCDDDSCYHCGYKFPADVEIEEDSPMDNGFCSQDCMDKKPTPCIRPMFDLLSDELGRDTAQGWDKSVYKGTDCGAWLTLNTSDQIMLGSIVEGSEVEVQPYYLNWPFTVEQFWDALTQINEEACFYWERDNCVWFTADFTPTDKPTQTYYGKQTWDEVLWDGDDVPNYVRNKTADWFGKGGFFDAYDKPVSPCLGLKLTEYCNDMEY